MTGFDLTWPFRSSSSELPAERPVKNGGKKSVDHQRDLFVLLLSGGELVGERDNRSLPFERRNG